jgi:hypothetical protein
MTNIAGSGSGSTPKCQGSPTLGVTQNNCLEERQEEGEEPVELGDGPGDGGEAFTF